MIAWTIYTTFAAAICALFAPRSFARWIALLATTAGLSITCVTFAQTPIRDLAQFKTIVQVPWVPALGMNYHLAID